MNATKRAESRAKECEVLLGTVWDGLRGAFLRHESTILVLTLCAVYCTGGKAKRFAGSPEEAHQFIAGLASDSPPEFNRPLELLKSVPPGLLVKILGVLDQISAHPEGLETLWDEAAKMDRGSRMTRFLTPGLASFCAAIADVRRGEAVLCPFTASFDFAQSLHRRAAAATFEARDNVLLALLFREIFDRSVNVIHADPIDRTALGVSKKERYDVVLSSPPLSQRLDPHVFDAQLLGYQFKTRHLEGLAIQQAVVIAKRRAVILVGLGMATRTTADERELKRYLVDQGLLEAVIKLPSGSFECTNVAPIAIVLRGSEEKPRPNTLFVDASYLDIAKGSEKAIADFVSLIAQGEDCEFMRNVGPDEIAQNLFNLDPARYPITEEKRKISSYLARRETVALSEICEILRPQLLLESEAGGQEVREVAFADIQEDGFILRPAKTRRIAHDTFKRSSRFIIRPGDILLSVKGTVGRIGLIQEAFDDACIPSQSFVLLRLDSREQRLSATYLFYFLSSPFGQGQINACKSGSVISILQSSDIKELRVALPKPGEEHKVAQTHQKIEHLRSEVLAAQAQMVALRRELFESENNGGKAGPTG